MAFSGVSCLVPFQLEPRIGGFFFEMAMGRVKMVQFAAGLMSFWPFDSVFIVF